MRRERNHESEVYRNVSTLNEEKGAGGGKEEGFQSLFALSCRKVRCRVCENRGRLENRTRWWVSRDSLGDFAE